MEPRELSFDTSTRFWSSEREAVNFFARHDGVELEFIVTREALLAVGKLSSAINQESALLTFDNYEDIFLSAAARVWQSAHDTQPVYFINSEDLKIT